jgi:hypothetical protein
MLYPYMLCCMHVIHYLPCLCAYLYTAFMRFIYAFILVLRSCKPSIYFWFTGAHGQVDQLQIGIVCDTLPQLPPLPLCALPSISCYPSFISLPLLHLIPIFFNSPYLLHAIIYIISIQLLYLKYIYQYALPICILYLYYPPSILLLYRYYYAHTHVHAHARERAHATHYMRIYNNSAFTCCAL